MIVTEQILVTEMVTGVLMPGAAEREWSEAGEEEEEDAAGSSVCVECVGDERTSA